MMMLRAAMLIEPSKNQRIHRQKLKESFWQ